MQREWEVVLGPPGCGKTTHLMAEVRAEILRERLPAAIAAVTFTRAAAKEIVRRVSTECSATPFDMPWVRTIHSMAYRLLGVERRGMMTPKAWQRFGERYAYVLSDVGNENTDEHGTEMPQRTEDDRWRHAYEWGRARRYTLDQTEYAYDPPLEAAHFRLFVERYESFKAQEGVRDFADLLEDALGAPRPGVAVAFIDEAQDLSPAQIACVEHWFADCERVVVVGDVDQAIYEFQGATPAWMTDLARQTTPRVLSQSYRVPAEPHALARAIITRNADRIDAQYAPRPADGVVENLSLREALQRLDPAVRTFILVRNRMFLTDPSEYCLRAGFPYLVEGGGGVCPYRRESLVRALRVAIRLSEGEGCTVADLAVVLTFVPARGSTLLARGFKAVIARLQATKKLTAADIATLGGGGLLTALQQTGPLSVFQRGVKPSELAYFQALLQQHHGIPEPTITLATIHGVKGREAPRVLVLCDLARATWRDYQTAEGQEGENRVFYVAVTRTQHELWLIRRETELYYRWPAYTRPPTTTVAAPPPVAAPTFDLASVSAIEFAGAGAPRAAWCAEWVEVLSRYVTLARTAADQPAARAAAPHLVCLTEDEYALLQSLDLEAWMWHRLHGHLFMFPRWRFRSCLAANVPNWERRQARLAVAVSKNPLAPTSPTV